MGGLPSAQTLERISREHNSPWRNAIKLARLWHSISHTSLFRVDIFGAHVNRLWRPLRASFFSSREWSELAQSIVPRSNHGSAVWSGQNGHVARCVNVARVVASQQWLLP